MYNRLESFLGKTVPNGQCVAFVKEASGAPQTALWKRGALVKGLTVPRGTAIATFDPPTAEFPHGKYGNREDGTCHAAIYLSQNADGLVVMDQWAGEHPQPVHVRTIFFPKPGEIKKPVNDGNKFYIIE